MIRLIFIVLFYSVKIISYLIVIPYLFLYSLFINLRRGLVRICK